MWTPLTGVVGLSSDYRTTPAQLTSLNSDIKTDLANPLGTRVLAHVEAGFLSGVLLGLLMGCLAAVWHTPVSFLFGVANEIVVTRVYQMGFQELAASMANPFAFFVIHLLIGAAGGLAAGLVLGLPVALLRIRVRRRFVFYGSVVVFAGSLCYLLLWLLHGKLGGADQMRGIVVVMAAALVLAALAALLVRTIGFVTERLTGLAPLAMWFRRFVVLAVGVLALILFIATGRFFGRNDNLLGAGSFPTRSKVVVIGLDGASWTYLTPLLREGALPNFRRLIEEGTSGALRTSLPPIESPTVWTTVATGKRPDKHGIHGFVMKSKKGDKLVPVTNDRRKAIAFWEIASDFGLTVDVVSWYVSWPAQEVNGAFISERLLFPDLKHVAVPASWTEALRDHQADYLATRDARLGRFTAYPFNSATSHSDSTSPHHLRDKHLSILDFSHRKDTVTFGVAMDLLDAGQSDVFAVYFEGIDRVCHRFLRHEFARRYPRLAKRLYPAIDDEELKLFRNVLREYYIQIDEWIGAILDRIDDDTAVMVISDHGFGHRKAWKVHVGLDPLLEFLGYLSFAAADSKTIRWEETRLYDAYRATKTAGGVLLNLDGRHTSGVVPADKWRPLLEEAREVLSGLRTQRGDPVFSAVKIERGAGRKRSRADIIVSLDERCLADSIEYYGRYLPVSAFTRAEWMPGNHRIDGIFIASGGPFRKGATLLNGGIRDITPTLLKIAGIPPAKDMDGRPLDRAFETSMRKGMVKGLVPSYERAREGEVADVESSPADSVIMQQLRALGYIK